MSIYTSSSEEEEEEETVKKTTTSKSSRDVVVAAVATSPAAAAAVGLHPNAKHGVEILGKGASFRHDFFVITVLLKN